MKKYFQEIFQKIGTEFWSNNPTKKELESAISYGAVCVATNPCYSSRIIKDGSENHFDILKKLINKFGIEDHTIPVRLHEEFLKLPLQKFLPLYKKSNGHYGLVAIQGDPRRNNDLDFLIEEAERFHKLGENIIIKVPSTEIGAEAMEELTARGWPTIGTMGFSVSQYIYMAEAYYRGLKRTKKTPRCLITVIPGIFDEYVEDYVKKNNIHISDNALNNAGISVVRETYKKYLSRKDKPFILVGGLRKTLHWIDIVGPDIGMTVGGSLADEILGEYPQIESRIEDSAPEVYLEELNDKISDFEKACKENGLQSEEFRDFGPVRRFQDQVLECYKNITSIIQDTYHNL